MADDEHLSPDLPRPAPPPTWGDLLASLRSATPRLAAMGSVIAIAAVGVGVALLVRSPEPPATESLLPYAGSAPAGTGAAPADGPGPAVATSSTAAVELVVHAAGAVAAPGVHRLPAGSRVADLLAAAGGALPDAELDRVNLAAPLADGAQVWFPRVGEPAPPAVGGGTAPADDAPVGTSTGTGPVDLNTATPEELDTLPGVGPATAAAIIEHRERNGPFRSVEELLEVPGIGDAKLAQLRDLVRV
jgi:competence protein ComEA